MNQLEQNNNELKIKLDSQETEFHNKVDKITKDFNEQVEINKNLEQTLEDKHKMSIEIEEKVAMLNNQVEVLTKAYNRLEQEKIEYKMKVDELKSEIGTEEAKVMEELSKLRQENIVLANKVDENKLGNFSVFVRIEMDVRPSYYLYFFSRNYNLVTNHLNN
jgi:chromosome segregation ATPase